MRQIFVLPLSHLCEMFAVAPPKGPVVRTKCTFDIVVVCSPPHSSRPPLVCQSPHTFSHVWLIRFSTSLPAPPLPPHSKHTTTSTPWPRHTNKTTHRQHAPAHESGPPPPHTYRRSPCLSPSSCLTLALSPSLSLLSFSQRRVRLGLRLASESGTGPVSWLLDSHR